MRRFAVLLAVLFLAACSTEIDQSTRPNSLSGSYALRTYGGRALPTVVSTDTAGVWEVVGGTLELGSDKSWTESVNYRLTRGTQVQTSTFSSSGSWSFLRDYAYMIFNDKIDNYQFAGTAAGGSVTLELSNGNILVYSR